MKKILSTFAIIVISTVAITACANKTAGTALGGVTGAGLGAAVTGGSAVGVGVGAVGGALIGNSLSR